MPRSVARQACARSEREHGALLVEAAVAGAGRAHVAAEEHLLVLERRGVHLAVAGVLERLAHAATDRAELAHLLGQHVPRPRRQPRARGRGAARDGAILSGHRMPPGLGRHALRGLALDARAKHPQSLVDSLIAAVDLTD